MASYEYTVVVGEYQGGAVASERDSAAGVAWVVDRAEIGAAWDVAATSCGSTSFAVNHSEATYGECNHSARSQPEELL